MQYKKVAIIGGAGFLGLRLSNRLQKAGIVHERFDIKYLDGAARFLDIESSEDAF